LSKGYIPTEVLSLLSENNKNMILLDTYSRPVTMGKTKTNLQFLHSSKLIPDFLNLVFVPLLQTGQELNYKNQNHYLFTTIKSYFINV